MLSSQNPEQRWIRSWTLGNTNLKNALGWDSPEWQTISLYNFSSRNQIVWDRNRLSINGWNGDDEVLKCWESTTSTCRKYSRFDIPSLGGLREAFYHVRLPKENCFPVRHERNNKTKRSSPFLLFLLLLHLRYLETVKVFAFFQGDVWVD